MADGLIDYIVPRFCVAVSILGIAYLIVLQYKAGRLVRSIRQNPHGINGPIEGEPGDGPDEFGANDRDIL